MASPESGERGTHLLTLSGHPGQTLAFSDRPQRNFGQFETSGFLDSMGFTPENPPNAALVVSTPAGDDDILVPELLNPTYVVEGDLLIYEAMILAEYAREEPAPVADGQDDLEMATEFEHVSLFIDDCADGIYFSCAGHKFPIPGSPVGMCWSGAFFCVPCIKEVIRICERADGRLTAQCTVWGK